MANNQVTLAKYKSHRLVPPGQMADEYVCIDEVEYTNYPVITINSSPGAVGDVVRNEIKFNYALFATYSPLLRAFYENYRYFRCRACEVTYAATDYTVDFRRTQVGCYWIPDHYAYDNNADPPINSWPEFMEKPNTSMLNARGDHGIFKIKYVPQLVKQDDNDEDDPDPLPDVIYQVRGDFPMGWMPTNEFNKTIDLRGPMAVFRRPYSPAGGIATPEVSYSITVKTYWEFKKAKVN